ncbi:MAG: ABC transporter substrate-binding protein [Candidatus Desulfaltia sp.]|nr:ABC transporter substrate-binding protein [Candidatus Desulfaltia sp.]
MRKKIFAVLVVIISVLAAASVASGKGESNSFTDESGSRITVKEPFMRIISLYGAHTENLFSLGLDREITGVSENEAYPPQAMTKPIFSYHDDAEKFIAARPDLVLIRPMIAQGYKNLTAKLQKAGITVVSLQPNTMEEVYSYWKNLGRLTGREIQAQKMIGQFQAGIREINSLVKAIPLSERKKVYFEAIHSKMKTFSPSSIAIFALKSAGGINVAADAKAVRGTNIAAYGKERILSHAKEIDVYLAQRGVMNRAKVRRIMEEGGFRAIKAVREGKIYIIDEKIVSRPTLRLLDGIYETGRILYPERFNDVTPLKEKSIITRAEFAEMFIKIMNIPLKTPDYRHDILKKPDIKHKYGDFKDVDYAGNEYKFIETAVSRGLFDDIGKYEFHPDMPAKRGDMAYSLFVYFDFPDAKSVAIKDVHESHPLFNQIQTVAGLNIVKLNKDGEFLPDNPVSGKELFQIISKAKELSYKEE